MIRIAVLLLAIAILPARSQEAQIVADTFHLSGPNMIRYQTMAGFTEQQRVLIVGAHTGAGCGFHSRGPGRSGWMEWIAESDPAAKKSDTTKEEAVTLGVPRVR